MTESTDASPAIQNLVAFARALRRAGLTVGTERTLAYCRAAATLGPSDLDDLYWAGRLTLLASRDEIPIYERVFRAFFLGDEADARRHRKMALRLVIEGELPDSGLRASDLPAEETERPSRELALTAASPTEVLRRRSFEEYSEEDHARA
ncbi:MAG: hypothetical protein GWN71_37185, partial [Gammaproteobacteria bacterium]|nr:hypothetical protein [Gemmatimonadota bacterium]NIU78985.1 hypothetical protein [Gammaproteobacteria bacterium]NIX24589.1 hypothetical protein [Actinomycetota bacterium]